MLIRLAAMVAAGALVAGIPVGVAAPAHAADESECQALGEDDPPQTTALPSTPLGLLHIGEAHAMFAKAGKEPGDGVTVAVVDSGVAATPYLDSDTLSLGEFATLPVPMDYHGTAVAGLIAGDAGPDGPVGIAPAARILDMQVYDDDEAGAQGVVGLDPANVIAGLKLVLKRAKKDPSIQVVNISLAMEDSKPLEKVIRKLVRRDVVVVAASGNRPRNDGEFGYGDFAQTVPRDDEAGEDAASYFYPGGYPDVLTVNATGGGWSDSDDVRAFVLQNSRTDVAAPTYDAVTLDRRGGTCRLRESIATSWATAEVSGVVALLRSWYPDESASQIVARLKATANGIEPDAGSDAAPMVSPLTGAGVIQPVEALTRRLTVTRAGVVLAAVDEASRLPPARAPRPQADPLGSMRENAVWWGLLGGGAIVLALLARPLLTRLRRS